jgi:lysozyme
MYELIKKWESFRAEAYPDPATGGEPWTIAFGATVYPDGRKVKKGDVCTSEETGEKYIQSYVDKYVMPEVAPLKLKGPQLDAVVSLLYNVKGGFARMPKLRAALGAYKAAKTPIETAAALAEVCRQWDAWNGNGKPMKGLIKRRVEELALFIRAV